MFQKHTIIVPWVLNVELKQPGAPPLNPKPLACPPHTSSELRWTAPLARDEPPAGSALVPNNPLVPTRFLTLGADTLGSGTVLLTFKDGADLPPGCDASLARVLAQRCLQEEDRNATGKEEDEVGDEEGTCGGEADWP